MPDRNRKRGNGKRGFGRRGEKVSADQGKQRPRDRTHHVEDDDGRDEANTESGDKTSDDNCGESGGGKHLDDDSGSVDHTARDDSRTTTDAVGNVTGEESAEESAGGQDGDDERSVRRGDGLGPGAFDSVDENLTPENAVNVARVVAEEDTSESGEGATARGGHVSKRTRRGPVTCEKPRELTGGTPS